MVFQPDSVGLGEQARGMACMLRLFIWSFLLANRVRALCNLSSLSARTLLATLVPTQYHTGILRCTRTRVPYSAQPPTAGSLV